MAIYVVTYGTTLDMTLDEYAQICDLLESDIEDKLKEIFLEVSYAEDFLIRYYDPNTTS